MELVRLLKKRHARGALARSIGVSHSTLCRWLAGEVSPTFADITAIIRFTGDDPRDIVHFFEDLVSETPSKAPLSARQYIIGIRREREWRGYFK